MEGCDFTGGKLEQLDLNAPLISTRRLGGLAGGDNTTAHQKTQEAAAVHSPGDACTSVPFLWEAAPGVPKAADCDEAAELPRPPPPPARWRPPGDDGGGWDSDPAGRRGGPDDSGHEGDVDNGSCGDEDVVSISADHLASPTDSLSVACSLDQADGAVRVEEDGELCRSPFPAGFMMQRFLPAAAAVATSFPSDVDGAPRKPPRRSVRAPPRGHHQLHYYYPRENQKMTIEAGLQLDFARRSQSTRSYSSSKGCGITVFFPWGFKQAFCGFKSSVQSRASFDRRRSHESSRGVTQDGGAAPRHSFPVRGCRRRRSRRRRGGSPRRSHQLGHARVGAAIPGLSWVRGCGGGGEGKRRERRWEGRRPWQDDDVELAGPQVAF